MAVTPRRRATPARRPATRLAMARGAKPVGANSDLWTNEKKESLAGLSVVKEEALKYLRAEKTRLLRLSHQEALDELLRATGIDSRIQHVEQVEHGNLLGV